MKRIAVLLCLCAVACSSYGLVPPGRHKIGSFYSVESSIAWSKTVKNGAELWTVDGPALEALRFTRGVADGKPVFEVPGKSAQQLLFRADMSESELMELIVDSFSRTGAGRVSASGLHRASFGPLPGFQFTLEYLTGDGLPSRGLATGAVADGKLYLIVYSAARDHYYDQYSEYVQAMLGSISVD